MPVKKPEENSELKILPNEPSRPTTQEIDINDIKILYQLSQQAMIKVAEINIVKPVLDKVEAIINMK